MEVLEMVKRHYDRDVCMRCKKTAEGVGGDGGQQVSVQRLPREAETALQRGCGEIFAVLCDRGYGAVVV